MRWHVGRSLSVLATMLLAFASTGCMGDSHSLVPTGPAASLGRPPSNVPTELNKIPLPPYVIEAPDILLVEVYTLPREKGGPATVLGPQPIGQQHLVRPDGTINLGIWGSISVTGLTTDQAREAVRRHVFNQMRTIPFMKEKGTEVDDIDKLYVVVDVLSYNSKFYYVVTDGAGFGEQIYRFPIQGSETVIDALANINGLPAVASKSDIWIARRTPHTGQPEQLLRVDYDALVQQGVAQTGYQLLPGDRVYVKAEQAFRIDGYLQKMLTPLERLLGVTLLGSSSYNQIANRGLNNFR